MGEQAARVTVTSRSSGTYEGMLDLNAATKLSRKGLQGVLGHIGSKVGCG